MVNEEGTILAARTTPADLDTFLPSLHKAVGWLLGAAAFAGGLMMRRAWRWPVKRYGARLAASTTS
jgi:hypothetical protein